MQKFRPVMYVHMCKFSVPLTKQNSNYTDLLPSRYHSSVATQLETQKPCITISINLRQRLCAGCIQPVKTLIMRTLLVTF